MDADDTQTTHLGSRHYLCGGRVKPTVIVISPVRATLTLIAARQAARLQSFTAFRESKVVLNAYQTSSKFAS